MAKHEKSHIFDNPRNVKRAIHALYAVCALSIVAEFFINRHVDHPWEVLFGFYGVYGFIACTILVLAAKELRKVLMRRQDYYDE